jgi:hypothetical protein
MNAIPLALIATLFPPPQAPRRSQPRRVWADDRLLRYLLVTAKLSEGH